MYAIGVRPGRGVMSRVFRGRDVDSNRLSGTIPSSIGQLTAMTALYVLRRALRCTLVVIHDVPRAGGSVLDNNALSGTIPASIGHMTLLAALYR